MAVDHSKHLHCELLCFLCNSGFLFSILGHDLDTNIFSKVMMIARAAERFIKDGGVEGGNTAIEAWKNGIGEEMSLEEGREYYRNHPVMKLVTELLLKSSVYFSIHHILLIEKAISEWEKTDIKKRRWDQLCKDVVSSRRFIGKKEEDTEQPKSF